MQYRTILLALLMTLIIAACSGGAAEIVTQPANEPPVEKQVDSEPDSSGDDADLNTDETSEDMPAGDESLAYFSAALVDASTGNSFKIEDFSGKVVLVETLAMWCSNCFRQQNQVKALHEMIGERDDFISLGLDIDPNENITDLKGYVEKNGFHWWYAVAPLDVARELGQLYGAQFLNPPSTPMLIIDRGGNVHPLPFGIKSAEQLMESLQPFLAES